MLLEINNIQKTYRRGKVKANDGITLSVEKGEIFGLLGPNGAGKTTLVKQIIGLAKPDSGSITVNGIDAVASPGYARQICSFQSQSQAPTVGLTPLQAIELVGKIRGGKKADVKKRTRALINSLEMNEWEKTIGLNSTGGVQRLVSFCMAVVVPGDVVILDEPTNDIDPLRRRLLWQEVQGVAETGSAVLLVTHNVLEAERVVNRLAIIDQGKVKGVGTPAELKTGKNNSMRLELILEPSRVIRELPDFLAEPIVTNRRILARVGQESIPEAIERANTYKKDGLIEEYSLSPTTLEDVYINMVGRIEDEELPEGVAA
ncbi:MAG: ATP-binding cassette domain-containing protein [Dehalococcoidales bacterium]|nr:ATP-binding cassette domain-containing protein [Dehalococcoidales bacterium]